MLHPSTEPRRLSRGPLRFALPLLLALAACEQAESAAPATAAEAPAAASDRGPLGTARALALAPVNGSTPVEKDIRAYQESARKAADKVDPWILLGRAWVRRARESADPGYYLNARACADVVLDFAPQNRLAQNLVALVALNDHRFTDALDLADQILVADPEDLYALGTRSDALLELGRFEESAAAAQKMVDLKPNLPSYSRASYLRWMQGDAKAAKDIIRLAMDAGRDPRDREPAAWVLVQAAMIFWHEGDHEGADAGFSRALDWFSGYPPALVGRGRVALAQGDAKRAAELFARAYAESPLVETAWLLGDAKQAAGDEAGAAEAYALVVQTGRQTDHRTLAAFLATKGRDTDEAVRLAEGEAKTRGGPYTDDALAWALYRAGRVAEARAASDRAMRLGTPDATLRYHAGAIRVASGDKEGGRKLVAQALAQSPGFDWTGAKEAQALLDEMSREGKK
jgi:tetratricopeptide (TPR) repeat protein